MHQLTNTFLPDTHMQQTQKSKHIENSFTYTIHQLLITIRTVKKKGQKAIESKNVPDNL